jgi:hypothetical protein
MVLPFWVVVVVGGDGGGGDLDGVSAFRGVEWGVV